MKGRFFSKNEIRPYFNKLIDDEYSVYYAGKSSFVMQMLCDVLGAPIEVSECSDACAMGAAVHAAVAAGLYPTVLEAEDALCPGACATYTPDEERHAFYLRRYQRYKELAQFVL